MCENIAQTLCNALCQNDWPFLKQKTNEIYNAAKPVVLGYNEKNTGPVGPGLTTKSVTRQLTSLGLKTGKIKIIISLSGLNVTMGFLLFSFTQHPSPVLQFSFKEV